MKYVKDDYAIPESESLIIYTLENKLFLLLKQKTKQDLPSHQQISTKKGPERYF